MILAISLLFHTIIWSVSMPTPSSLFSGEAVYNYRDIIRV